MHRFAAFAIGVLRDLYAFHRYTTNSAYLSHTLDPHFHRLDYGEPQVFTDDLTLPLLHLYT